MGCSTRIIYKNVRKFSKPQINKNYKFNFKLKNLMKLKNDLEKIAIKKYPTLLTLKKILEKLPRVKFVRMTGSGSSILGYFNSKKASLNGVKILKKNIKIIGVFYLKLYKFFFLCYTNLILGRSQAVRQRFLVPPS